MALLASEVNGLTGLKDSKTSSTLLVARLKVTDTVVIMIVMSPVDRFAI